MKFLHTADWQIGMKAAGLGGAAEAIREERSYAAKRALDVAKEKEVDFIILAGDSFEDNAVDRLLVQRVADILSTFSGPVYIIPGKSRSIGSRFCLGTSRLEIGLQHSNPERRSSDGSFGGHALSVSCIGKTFS